MIVDKFSGCHSKVHPAALQAHEQAVREFAAHRPFMPHLQEALRIEPSLPAARALFGITHALIGRAHGMATARASLPTTRSALVSAGGGTSHERALAGAHVAAAAGRLKSAAFHLEQHLQTHPADLLALKLSHALRFMTGQPGNMLRTTAALLPSWSASMPGYGFVLGCRAFALEETGNLREAETAGRQAVACQPDDVWGLHAVAHVLEMGGRTREGRKWLGAQRLRWGDCGAFGQHLLWHLALFHLSDGDSERALALFDEGIQPARDGDFRDVANAVSLLWRLEQEGVDVGHRWRGLHELAHERRLDCTYAFASLHYLMALLAAGDEPAARECIAAMRKRSRGNGNDQAPVLALAGVALAEALLAATVPGPNTAELGRLARELPQLGGSRAQQDVFLRSLMMMAARSNDTAALSALSALRREQRVVDRFQLAVSRGITSKGHHAPIAA
jgi:tetratricopeptide (TPR) repeat protein